MTPVTVPSRADKVFNFVACLIDAVGFPAGIAFFAVTTILPTFLQKLGAGDVAIGALSALLNLIAFVPGLLVVPYLRRLPRVRTYLLGVALVERLALLPLAFLAPLWGRTHPQWLIVAVFVCFTGHGLSMGFNIPAYWMAVGKTVPAHWRGRLYGYAGGLAGLLAIGTEWILRHVVFAGPDGGFPEGYGRGFLIGFIVLTVSVLPLGWLREPISTPPEPTEGRRPLLDIPALRALWRGDAALRRFLRASALAALTGMAAPFFVVYAAERLHASPNDIAIYTATTVFAGAFGSLFWGALADRIGNQPVVLAGVGCGIVAAVLAASAPSPALFIGVFVLISLSSSGFGLASNNHVMELAGDAGRIGLYTSFYNILTALPRAAAPLLGGMLAGVVGYPPLFVLCALLGVGALVLLRRSATDLAARGL
jgi:MFS family permease